MAEEVDRKRDRKTSPERSILENTVECDFIHQWFNFNVSIVWGLGVGYWRRGISMLAICCLCHKKCMQLGTNLET